MKAKFSVLSRLLYTIVACLLASNFLIGVARSQDSHLSNIQIESSYSVFEIREGNFPSEMNNMPDQATQQQLKLYLRDYEGHLSESYQSDGKYYQTVWNSGSREWKKYFFEGDIVGDRYYYKVLVASFGTTNFKLEILIGEIVVASTAFSATSTTYSYRTGWMTGVDPDSSTHDEIVLRITIVSGDRGGVLWGDYRAVDSYILFPEVILPPDPFTRITTGNIVNDGGDSFGTVWGDYDNDGYLDLFVANGYWLAEQNNFLYRNNGDDTFTKITTGDIVNDGADGTGGSWADYNNDGYLDLFVTNCNCLAEQGNFLYRNNSDGSFTEIITGDIVNDKGPSWSSSWGDYDNDGDLDLFVTNVGPNNNFLYQNNGDGTFTKITTGDIVNDGGDGTGGSWCDYDNDGDLDLFVTNGGNEKNFLYRNDGNGAFVKIITGDIVNDTSQSESCSWGDYDNDGDLDLFVANGENENNLLYVNNGDGIFTKVITGDIVNDGGWSWSSSCGDYDNDGDLDLFVANRDDQNNFLYSNNGNGTFTKITTGYIVNDGGNSRGSSWGDYDNDGDLDLFVANSSGQNNCLYRNYGDGTFAKITAGNIANDAASSYGCSWGDYDNDGDLDLFVPNSFEQNNNLLYANNGNSNNWINIKCVGTVSNTSAIGAKVWAKAIINGSPVWQMNEISGQTGGGFGGQNSLNAEFGLGDATIIDSIKIEWPSGIVQVLTDVAANQFLTVTEKSAITVNCPDTSAAPGDTIDIPVFVDDVTGRGIISVGLTVEADTSVLSPLNAFATGSIAESWGNPTWNIFDGQMSIGMSGTTPLSGSGSLVFIRYQVNPAASTGDTTTIHLDSVLFNEGDPPAITADGLFTVGGLDIRGNISYFSNSLPAKNAAVSLTGVSNLDDTTDINGNYEFLQVLFGNYTSRPTKEGDLNTAISPYDAALVLQDYVGLIDFGPYQKIAGDVSGNGQVTPYDASLILQYWVGLIANFPAMADVTHFWTFAPDSFSIDDTNWSNAPDSIRYEPLNSDKHNQDFVGIVYGDPSGNWSPSGALASSGKTASKSVTFGLGEVSRTQDKIFSIPVTVDDGSDLISAGFTIEYDPEVLQVLGVSGTELTSGYSIAHKVERGRIKAALAGAEPLSQGGAIANIRFEALKTPADAASPLFLAEAVVNEGRIIANLQQAEFSFPSASPTEFALFQNYPNPFNPQTTIKYQLPRSSKVVLKVFDLLGREISTLVNEEKDAGFYEVRWDGRDSYGRRVSSGIYVYRIQAGDFVQSKKMAILK